MISKKKKVAVFGLGIEQTNGIKNLKNFFSVYGFDDNKEAYGIRYVNRFIEIPLKEKNKILKFLKQKKIDYLFSFCSEATLQLLYFLNEKLCKNKSYNELIKKVCNKNIFRKHLLKHNVENPRFALLKSKKQLSINKIIKPIFGSGSKNIVVVDKSNIKSLKLKNYSSHIIEDYFEGEMYAIDGFCIKKKFIGLALSKKFRDSNSPLIDKKIIFNYQNKDLFKKASILAQKCCWAVNAQDVPIHFEFILTRAQKIYPIDFAVRGAGSGLFNYCLSELMSHDCSDYQIKLQLNEKILFKKKKKVFFYLYFLTSDRIRKMKKINLKSLKEKKLNYKVILKKKN